MIIDLFIEKINAFLSQNKLTKIEEKRLLNNLDVIYDRLRKGEYKKTSFSKNKFDVPNRAKEIYTDLQFYSLLGKTWAQLLEPLEINKFTKIVDLCPGYTPKIELALFYLGYKGEVIVLDNDVESVTELKKFMALFNPQFAITERIVNLFNPSKEKYQLVLANHVIDDLVLSHFSQKKGVSLKNIYEKEGALIDLWKYILSNKESHLNEIIPRIASVFDQLIEKNGLLCMSHYKSYMEKILDMDDAAGFNREVFKQVAQELSLRGFVQEGNVVENLKKYKGHFTPRDCAVLRKTN
jgi:hypothetical protein